MDIHGYPWIVFASSSSSYLCIQADYNLGEDYCIDIAIFSVIKSRYNFDIDYNKDIAFFLAIVSFFASSVAPFVSSLLPQQRADRPYQIQHL